MYRHMYRRISSQNTWHDLLLVFGIVHRVEQVPRMSPPYVGNFRWAADTLNSVWSRNLLVINLLHLLPETYVVLKLKNASHRIGFKRFLTTYTFSESLLYCIPEGCIAEVCPLLSILDMHLWLGFAESLQGHSILRSLRIFLPSLCLPGII